MKYRNIIITASTVILVAIAAVVFYACNKENLKDNLLSTTKAAKMSSELQDLYKQMPAVDYGNIKVINGDILQFESKEHYKKVVEQLTQQYEKWSTLFLDKYDVKITEDELDNIQNKLGFSDCIPMIKFEEKLGIYGKNLRYIQRKIEDDWLDKGAIGTPLTDKVIIDPAEQTLLNQYREACIGDTICQVREDASILIPVRYASELPTIREMSTEALAKDKRFQAIIKAIILPITCYNDKWYKGDHKEHPSNEKKFWWEFEFKYSWFFGCSEGVSEMHNYKKNNKGKWVNDWAICALGQSYKVYYSLDYYACKDLGTRGCGLQTPHKFISRSIRSSYVNPDNKRNRIDPANSKTHCRHNGWTFTFNVGTGAEM